MEFDKNVLFPYQDNEDALIKAITTCSQKNPAFKVTLQHLGAETFLVEEDYVDKDYLDDYTNFYARCHQDYPRFCKRIHFFKKVNEFSFTTDVLRGLLSSSADEQLIQNIQKAYLGFVVLKPSKGKETMIGTTCLAHYQNDEVRTRNYTAIREYPVNLFGIPLSIKSMAFQEQDETVAMCASIAVWSALSITGKKYQHRMPSPSEVTNLALSETSYKRDFPNEGLTAEQMGVAMAKVRLKPLILRTTSNRHLKGLIYAYSKAGIPVVCGLSLYNEFKGSKGIDVGSKSFHAVTINGFSFEGGTGDINFRDELKLVSTRMTRVYAHDDQLCPFTKMLFDPNFTRLGKMLFNKIETTWQANSDVKNEGQKRYKDHKIAKVESLIIPLYHKIRINYFDILPLVQVTAKTLSSGLQEVFPDVRFPGFEWDIFLTEVAEFKKDILLNKFFPQKETILTGSLAKYLWRAQAVIIQKDEQDNLQKNVLMEIVFDATDSKKRGISSFSIYYDETLMAIFNPKNTLNEQNN